MLYIGYLIILDGKNVKGISFGNFHFLVAEARKLHQRAGCALAPLGTSPPKHPNRVKNKIKRA